MGILSSSAGGLAITRRQTLAVALAAPFAARGSTLPPRSLAFEVWRGRSRIGRHTISFAGGGGTLVADIVADIAVAFGPITFFRYQFRARETWRDGRFAELISHSLTNGRREMITAIAAPDGVAVRTLTGAVRLRAGSLPLTHWNERALASPLFNPETGKAFRLAVARQTNQVLTVPERPPLRATRIQLTGDEDIVDWYDTAGVWRALDARATDGSHIEYREVA